MQAMRIFGVSLLVLSFLTPAVLHGQESIVVSAEAKESLWQDVQSVPAVGDGEDYEQQNQKRYAKLVSLVDELGNGVKRIDHRVLQQGTGPELAIPNVVFKIGNGVKPTIVVGAHLDKVEEAGTGVIDDWTGCANIIHASKALLAKDGLKHNFVFVCFAYEEKNLWGSQTFVNDLKASRHSELNQLLGGINNVKAMLNFECLGVSELYGWKEGATPWLADLATGVANRTANVSFRNREIGLPVGADSVPFFYEGIPSLTIDSLESPGDFSKIHSSQDVIGNIGEVKIKNTLEYSVKLILELDKFAGSSFAGYKSQASLLRPPKPASHPNVVVQSYAHSHHHRVGPSSFSPNGAASFQSESLVAVPFGGTVYIVGYDDQGRLWKTDIRDVPSSKGR